MIVAKDSDSKQMMDTDGPDIFNRVRGPLLVMGKYLLFLFFNHYFSCIILTSQWHCRK